MKVSDEGGGIKRSNMNRIWSYLYTTAHSSALDNMLTETHHSGEPVLPMKIMSHHHDRPSDHPPEPTAADLPAGSVPAKNVNPLRDFATASPLAGLGY